MTSSKFGAYAIFLLGIALGILLGQNFAPRVTFGATTFETSVPNVYELVDFPLAGGVSTSTPNYVFYYQIPLGITFDRLQMAVPDTQGQYNRSYAIYTANIVPPYPWSCFNQFCQGTQSVANDVVETGNIKVNNNTLQFNFSSATTTTGDVLVIVLDPNPPPQDFEFFGTTNQVNSRATNGFGYSNSLIVPSIRLCNVTCDTDSFDLNYIGEIFSNNSFITITEPDYGTTTATTTVDVSAFFAYDGSLPTTTITKITITDAVTNQFLHETSIVIPSFTDGFSFSLPATFEMSTGSKNIVASYTNLSGEVNFITPKTSFFSVITNTYLLNTGLETPTSDPYDLSQIDCNTFDIGCQFQKALVFLFVPPQTTLDKFNGIWQELKTLKPFGYVTVTIEQLKNITSSGSGAYSLPEIPFISAIFEPLRNGIAILLWGIFAFVFYNKRLKNIDI